jgi:alpha-tubulin suppressor-like RCC1 family protein
VARRKTIDFRAQLTGGFHTCAVKITGEIFCWGYGANGRLGTNATTDEPLPAQEATGATDWVGVSAGRGAHTCASKTDGRLFCWGAADQGQLGHGLLVDSLVPVQEASGAQNWALVEAGYAHSCAITAAGRLYCFGAAGRLGSDTGKTAEPVQEASAAASWSNVAVGQDHACGVKADGRLFCWGIDAYGRLGIGRLPVWPAP